MGAHEESAEVTVGIKVECQAIYGEATFNRIVGDAIFFHQKAEEYEIDDQQGKRYARIAILLMAFYFESLSNLIFEKLVKEDLDNLDKRTDLPEPIRRFRAVYKVCSGKEMGLNIDGIRDIFTIRNRIIAHPSGRAQLQIAGVRGGRLDKHVDYYKFHDFPLIYSQFTIVHATKILLEVKEFLTKFADILRKKIANDQIDEWWPMELVKWSKSVTKH